MGPKVTKWPLKSLDLVNCGAFVLWRWVCKFEGEVDCLGRQREGGGHGDSTPLFIYAAGALLSIF